MSRCYLSRVLLDAIRPMAMAVVVAVTCTSAIAQQHERSPGQHAPDRQGVPLQDRDRELLHPGDPLRIVAPGENGHDFRAETPALAQTQGRVAALDPEEMHRRAIALYERGTLLAEPTAPSSNPVAFDRAPSGFEGAERLGGAGTPRAGPKGSGLEWVLGAIVVVWILVRSRKVLVRGLSAPVPAASNGPIRVPGRPWKRAGPPPDGVKAPLPSRAQPRHQERSTTLG